MYEEEEAPLTQTLNTFQISINELDDDLRDAQSEYSNVSKELSSQHEETCKLQQKCLNDQLEYDLLQEKRNNARDYFESSTSTIKKLERKQYEVNEKLDLMMNAYDSNYLLNQKVKESFNKKVKQLNRFQLMQDQDVNDVRNVGKATEELLQLNLEEKERFYDQLKDIESSDESLDEQLSTLDNHLGNSNLENCKKTFSELKKEGEMTIFKSNNLKSTIEQIESRASLNLDEWNSKWIKEEENLNEIKRLNEEYLRNVDKLNTNYKNNSNHLESERRRAQSLQQCLEEIIKDASKVESEMSTAKETQKELLGVDDVIKEQESRIFQIRKNIEEKSFDTKQLDDQFSSSKDKVEKKLQLDSTLGAELAEIQTEEDLIAYIQQRSDEIVDIENLTKNKKLEKVTEEKSLKQKVAEAKALLQEKRKACQGNLKMFTSLQEETKNIQSDENKKGEIIGKLDDEIAHARELQRNQKSVEEEREHYYNLYNSGIAHLQKRQHEIDEAKILKQKLDETNKLLESRKEETLNKVKEQLKRQTDELQKSKMELKSKVDMEKAAMSKIQYDYYTSKNACHEGEKRLATLRAMNEIAKCENEGAKTYLNWLTTGEYLSKYLKKDQESQSKDKDEFLFSQMLNKKDSDIFGTVKGSQDMELDEIVETERRIEALENSQIGRGSNWDSPQRPYDKNKFMYVPEKDVQPSDGAVSVVNLISEDQNKFMNSPNKHIQSQCDSVVIISSDGAYERNKINNAGNLKDFELKKPFPIQSKQIHSVRPLQSQNINSQIQKPPVVQPPSFKRPQLKENRFFKTATRNTFTSFANSLNKASSSKSLKHTYQPTKLYDSDADDNPYTLFASPKHEVSSSTSKQPQQKKASQNSQKPRKKPAAKKSTASKKKDFDEKAHQDRMLNYIQSVQKSDTLKD